MKRTKPIGLYTKIALASIFTAYPAACRWFNFYQRPMAEKILLVLGIGLVFLLAGWLTIRLFPGLKTVSRPSIKGLIAAGLASLIVLIIFHWQPPSFPSTFNIGITANGNATLSAVHTAGEALPLDRFATSGGWLLTKSGWQHNGDDENRLSFTGSASAPVELVFTAGPDNGSVSVNMQNSTTQQSLNTPMLDTKYVQPFPGSLGSPSLIWFIWVSLLAITEWLVLTALLYFLFSRHTAGTVAALFPLVFLLPYVTTIAGYNVTLGNDFGPFYFVYKNYLLDFLSNGHFPLWSPMEGGGYPFFSDPLTQAVYPPNMLLALLYRINQGYTHLDHQVFTVAAICWFSLGLYTWLRSLKIDRRFAVFAALTMALSYKMVELLRFPNAAHEAAWYPWILLALTGLFKAVNWRSAWKWSAVLTLSLICLFTAGYPYYVYYLPFLAAPYMVFMLIPHVRKVIFDNDRPDWRKFITGFLIACVAAVLVCGPYLLNMGQTIAQTSGRAGDDFTHATMYPFDFQDTLESLVYPVGARPEGWFYFGALAFTVMVLYLAHPEKDTADGEEAMLTARRAWPVKMALMAWLLFLSYLSYGEQSYLFLLFYKILPEFSALRGWGRLSIALLPGLSLLLAYAMGDLESRLRQPVKGRIKPWMWISLALVTVFSLGYQWFEYSKNTIDEYWELYFVPRTAYLIQTVANAMGKNIIPDPKQLSDIFSFSYMSFSLLAVLLVFMLLWKKHVTKGHEWILVAGLGVFSAITLWSGGPWLWNNGLAPKEERKTGNYQRMMSQSLSTPRKNENSTLTLSPSFSVGSPPKWHFARYQEFYFGSEKESAARDELLGVTNGNRFFFSSGITQPGIESFLEDAHTFNVKPVVHEYTGDSLLVELTAPVDGYFSFIDNWDTDWRARVDGSPVKIDPLLGTFKSVKLTTGHHEVSMAYCPRFFEWANPACSR
jgi:hypothetical protein